MNRKTFLLSLAGALGLAAGGGAAYAHTAKFGEAPSGDRLARIARSPHYIQGRFECLHPVKTFSDEPRQQNMIAAWVKFLLEDKTGRVPEAPLPTEKTDLSSLPKEQDAVVWLGHSSFYLQLGGRRLLLDPVMSSYASPVFFINRTFPGSNVYRPEEIPPIDVLVISHDHWDHLDYATVSALMPRVKEVVCPLGVGAHLERWGFSPSQLHEEDWDTDIALAPDFHIHVLPGQHFSGRMLHQNNPEWAGFAFITPRRKVFFSGDSGYADHFQAIGKKFGGFDLALMENGQYNLDWHKIHMLPSETAQAAEDVGAKAVIPCHNGKFALARHLWYEPMADLVKESAGRPYLLITPKIGACVRMDDLHELPRWWEEIL